MTLTISTDKLSYLIGCAERLEAVSETLADALDRDGRRTTALGMYFESPTRHALVNFVDALRPAERRELLALMWLGRGDNGETAEDWPALKDEARRTSPNGDVLGLVGRNLLSNYLKSGLYKLQRSGAEPQYQ